MQMQDLKNEDFLLIVTDDGHDGLGRVLGYFVFDSEEEAAQHFDRYKIGQLCDMLGLFLNEDIPDDVAIEACSFIDFKCYYGNRMPLRNRFES